MADVPAGGPRVTLVTGAASGIGAATARACAAAGESVWCVDRDGAGLERQVEVVRAAGGTARAWPLDVTDEAGWLDLSRTLAAEEGRLDVVAHCAGVAAASPLVETSLQAWRQVLAVNLDGAFLAVREAVRLMGARGGAIVLVGSASGIRPPSGAAAYATSKGALAVLARAAARECREAGWPIRVNVLSPAGVRTPMWRGMPFFRDLVATHGSEDAAFAAMAAPGERFASADDVAALVRFLVSPASAHLTGIEVPADDGYLL